MNSLDRLRFIKIVSFLIGICLTAQVRADEAEFLTLEAALDELLATNPDVHAAHFRTEAARARIPQAKALDDPQVGVMFDDVPIDTANVRASEEIDYRIEQKIPFPGKRSVRGKAARFDAAAVRHRADADIRDVILDLKKTYYELYRIERSLEVNRENQTLLNELRASAEARYATGKSTADAPLKALVELMQLQNEGSMLDQERISHQAHLKALLSRTDHRDIRLPRQIEFPRVAHTLDELKAVALAGRPELGALAADEQRDRARLTEARQGLIPDFSLAFQYGDRPRAKNTWTGSAMINVPLFFFSKNRSEIREAQATAEATKAMRRSLSIHTGHEVEQLLAAVRSAEVVVERYQKKLLPQARTMLHAAQTAYASAAGEFLTLLDAARTYNRIHTAHYEQQSRLGQAIAELERLVGKDF